MFHLFSLKNIVQETAETLLEHKQMRQWYNWVGKIFHTKNIIMYYY